MNIFLLIVRIILLIVMVAGIIVSLLSGTIANKKHFKNETLKSYFRSKIKIIGYLITACALVVLMILSYLG